MLHSSGPVANQLCATYSTKNIFIFAQSTTRASKRHSLTERYHLGDFIEESPCWC
jgi:hypothetical protein